MALYTIDQLITAARRGAQKRSIQQGHEQWILLLGLGLVTLVKPLADEDESVGNNYTRETTKHADSEKLRSL